MKIRLQEFASQLTSQAFSGVNSLVDVTDDDVRIQLEAIHFMMYLKNCAFCKRFSGMTL